MTKSADHCLMPLPWHQALWNEWYLAIKQTRLHHALLLQGPSYAGKTEFVKAFAQLILCYQPRLKEKEDIYYSCGKCSACVWCQENVHPNYYEVKPNLVGSNKLYISIDQIRGLAASLQNTAMNRKRSLGLLGYHTVVVIDPIDALQAAAVHALLKTLEEPNLGVLFILTSAVPQALEPTITSRCQAMILPCPDETQALTWMKETLLKLNKETDESVLSLSFEIANGVPLKALHYLTSHAIEIYQSVMQALISLGLGAVHPGEVAQKWAVHPIEKILDYLMIATFQLTRFRLSPENPNKVGLDTSSQEFNQFNERVSLDFLFHYWRKLNHTRYEISLYNLNPMLALEMLAYSFSSSSSFS